MKDVNLNKDNNKNSLETNKEKQSGNLNIDIDGNKNKTTMNKNKTVDKSKTVDKNKTIMNKNKNVDKSKTTNKTITTNNNINKIYYSYRPNTNKEKQFIKRPGLYYKGENSIIHFRALIGGIYSRLNENCITIINLHSGKEYLADHTQLILNEKLEKFIERNKNNSSMIKSVGIIRKYKKSDRFDYCIELLPDEQITFIPDMYYNNKYYDMYIEDDEVTECYNKLMDYRHDDLLYLIKHLRNKIDELLIEIIPSDFIYHYIINQYSLNTLNIDMYSDSIQSNQFKNYELYNIAILLGNVLFDLCNCKNINIKSLFKNIAINLNALQGINHFKCSKNDSKELNKYFKILCERKNIKFGVGWLMVTNRRNNFKIYENEKMSISEVRKYGLIGICYSKK